MSALIGRNIIMPTQRILIFCPLIWIYCRGPPSVPILLDNDLICLVANWVWYCVLRCNWYLYHKFPRVVILQVLSQISVTPLYTNFTLTQIDTQIKSLCAACAVICLPPPSKRISTEGRQRQYVLKFSCHENKQCIFQIGNYLLLSNILWHTRQQTSPCLQTTKRHLHS